MIAPESRMANAFIYNNDIYINTDNANIKEAKMHELMHIFLGELDLLILIYTLVQFKLQNNYLITRVKQ